MERCLEMPPEPFSAITSPELRTRLAALRDGVRPVLQIDILHHFTDHGPDHSDRVASLASSLLQPVQASEHPLKDEELFVLFAACFLHDVGMHVEAIGDLGLVLQTLSRRAEGPSSWTELDSEQKVALMRDLHHSIGAALVEKSVNSSAPPIGFQLTRADNPGAIAALCEAHGTAYDSERYEALTRPAGGIRCTVLAALLRIADIADESSHRALDSRRSALDLDVASQVHWYRHRYTSEVTVVAQTGALKVTFDFPPDRRQDYAAVVPELHVPEIEEEVRRHTTLLAGFGGSWHVECEISQNPYSSTQLMPDAVLAAMAGQVHNRRINDAHVRQQQELRSFEEVVPLLLRQLEDAATKALPPSDYLAVVERVAVNLRGVGAVRTAWNTLFGPYSRLSSTLPAGRRVEMGVLLAELLTESEAPDIALRILAELAPVVSGIGSDAALVSRYRDRLASALIATGEHMGARQLLEEVVRTGSAQEGTTARADLADLAFLLGDLDSPWVSLDVLGRQQ
jgi:hypothetical protein